MKTNIKKVVSFDYMVTVYNIPKEMPKQDSNLEFTKNRRIIKVLAFGANLDQFSEECGTTGRSRSIDRRQTDAFVAQYPLRAGALFQGQLHGPKRPVTTGH